VELGDDVQLLPQVVCYSGTIVGNRVILHAGVRLGSDGFGYVPGKNGEMPRKIPRWVAVSSGTTWRSGQHDDRSRQRGRHGGRPGNQDRQPRADRAQLSHRCALLIAGQAGIAGVLTSRTMSSSRAGGTRGPRDDRTRRRVTVQGGVIGDIAPGATVSGYPARTHREFLRAKARCTGSLTSWTISRRSCGGPMSPSP